MAKTHLLSKVLNNISEVIFGAETLNKTCESEFIFRNFFIVMPYPCSHFYYDIKFGYRLYSKDKRRALPFEYNLSPKLLSKYK
jgi:hypothetical protein